MAKKKKFKSNFWMLLILIIYTGGIMVMLFNGKDLSPIYIGIVIALIHAILCFFVRKIRSVWSIVYGIVSVINLVWWIYAISKM